MCLAFLMANNISSYETNERKYETSVGLNVFGYLIGDEKNQKQPCLLSLWFILHSKRLPLRLYQVHVLTFAGGNILTFRQ